MTGPARLKEGRSERRLSLTRGGWTERGGGGRRRLGMRAADESACVDACPSSTGVQSSSPTGWSEASVAIAVKHGRWLSEPKKPRLMRPALPVRETAAPLASRSGPPDFAAAKLQSHMQGCLEITQAADGEFLNTADMRRYDARPLPVLRWCWPRGRLANYQLPVSVSLLLRFMLEAPIALLLMLVLSSPALVDNMRRTAVRNECRALRAELAAELAIAGLGGAELDRGINGTNDGLHGTTNGTSSRVSSLESRLGSCGGAYAPVRSSLPPVPLLLAPGLGSCEEYSNSTSNLQLDVLSCLGGATAGCVDLFVGTADAAYCVRDVGRATDGATGASLAWDAARPWLSSVGVTAAMLLFLARLCRLQ